ncbi:MAG: hypothetical protein OXC02_10090 [Rhodobacteraceae bacterium]|nr:hypothetical protein [Paracoccaceae bacterium]
MTPSIVFPVPNTQLEIIYAQKAINKLQGTDRKDRLAFAVWTAMKKRV